jgi:hypothetical protein
MRTRFALLLLALLSSVPSVHAAELEVTSRAEFVHPASGHEVTVSAAAVAAGAGGAPLVAWAASDQHTHALWLVRLDGASPRPVRVSPDGLAVDSLHQAPGLAVGTAGEVYVSWSSAKPKPEGALFVSDLRLSRSLDGGRSFEPPLRVNEDRPVSHSFEGLGVAADGTVLLAWIDSRDGPDRPATYLARIADRGSRVEGATRVDGDTCVCCRVSLATASRDTVALVWRKVFPGDIRDMVLGLSRDGGRTFSDPALVHADGWKITACPHRGGAVGVDAKGRTYVAWYTEATLDRPDILLAVSADGRRFGPPKRLHIATGSIPDQVRLAVNPNGQAVVVWQDSTAVRRRVLLRWTADGGRTVSAPVVLSRALKAWAPDVVVTPSGEFLIAWHEEQFPSVKTVTQRVRVPVSTERLPRGQP